MARCFTGWSIGRGGRQRECGGQGKYGQSRRVPVPSRPARQRREDGARPDHSRRRRHAGRREGAGYSGLASGDHAPRLHAAVPAAGLRQPARVAGRQVRGDLEAHGRRSARNRANDRHFAGVLRADRAYRSKIKSPFEYAVSSVRALGGTYENDGLRGESAGAQRLQSSSRRRAAAIWISTRPRWSGRSARWASRCSSTRLRPATRRSSQKWVSSGALISRLNFALALTAGKLNDVKLPGLDADAYRPSRTRTS